MRTLFGGVIAAVIAMTTASAQTQLVSEDVMVKSPDPGIEIFVRNKRPANMTSFRPERTVVFVHGATYPAHTAFDLRHNHEPLSAFKPAPQKCWNFFSVGTPVPFAQLGIDAPAEWDIRVAVASGRFL